jgi:hypothetical protein
MVPWPERARETAGAAWFVEGAPMKRTAAQRRRIALGCRSSRRSQAARERAALVLAHLLQLGRRDLIEPSVAETEIDRLVDRLAFNANPDSAEGRVLHDAAKRAPGTLAKFLRRNPQLVRQIVERAS